MKSQHIVGFLTISALLLTVAVYVSESQQSSNQSWESWKLDYGFTFIDEIDEYRKIIYMTNIAKIAKHNKQSGLSYTLGANHFAHLSADEFMHMFSNVRVGSHDVELGTKFSGSLSIDSNDIDWEKQGKVSPVKNQGNCDAGYAFCSASLGQSYTRFVNKSLDLSEQQIVDCSANYSTFGCSSGTRTGTLKYLQQQGVTTQSKYPYVGVKQNCKNIPSEFKLTSNLITTEGCDQLRAQLNSSPLTVAVNIQNWQLYKSGIFDNCGTEVSHDIFVVGWNEASWRLKNSWGVRWGEYGYIRLRTGNTCGICSKTGFGFKA